MDSREFSMKMDRLKELVAEKDYATALRIVETIDWERVKSAGLLALAASVYEENGMLEDARDKLVLALERSGGGKRILYKLTELAVRSGNVEEAMDYYNEYRAVAPDDPASLLLQYMILKVQHAPYSQLIKCLEYYIEYDPDEKWMYELATTYESAGRIQDAVNLCDRIAVMFGNTPYSVKALKLKQKYTKLTEDQRASLYPNSIAGKGIRSESREPEQTVSMAAGEPRLQPESLGDRLAANRIENEDLLFARYLAYIEHADEPVEEPQEVLHVTEENATEEELEALAAGKPVAVERQEMTEEPEEPVTPEYTASEEPEEVKASSEPEWKESEEPEDSANAQDSSSLNEGFIMAETEEEYPELPEEEDTAVEEPEQPVEIRVPTKKPEEVIRPQARTTFTVSKPEAPKEVEQTCEFKAEPLPKKKNVIGLHLIIEALDEEEGVVIAKKELQYIYQIRGASRNVAKATAEKLNKIGNMGDVSAKIGDRDLVIVRAGDMEAGVAEQIYNMLTEESDRSIVLVDTPEGLDMLEEMLPETFDICDILTDEDAREKNYSDGQGKPDDNNREQFEEPVYDQEGDTAPMPGPAKSGRPAANGSGSYVPFKMPRRDDEVMSVDDFAQYCVHYANEKGCSISGSTQLALYEKIELMEEEGVALTKAAAEDCIEDAADHAEHPGVKGAFRKKYDKDDMLILREEDFIN